MKTSSHFPRLLIFGKPERKEFRIWWENLNEMIRERAHFHENLSMWLAASELPSERNMKPEISSECLSGRFSESFSESLSENLSESFSENLSESLSENLSESLSERLQEIPDFIILLRSCPGEFREKDVWELMRKYPLTPILAVTGNWCEGESRSGFPLAGVHSVSWYDFAAMSPLEWWAFTQNWATVWALPPSTLPEHRTLFELKREEEWNSHASATLFGPIPAEKVWKIRIESDDFTQFSFLRDFCRRALAKMLTTSDALQISSPWERGTQGKILPTDPEADFLFFDFPDFMEETVQWFYSLKKRYPHAIYIAFTEFPRPDEWNFLKRCGVDAIFPKPFRIADLLFFCRQCLTGEKSLTFPKVNTE